ncbi:MAG: flagellar biosynthetic protein FliO [Wujia sp.]
MILNVISGKQGGLNTALSIFSLILIFAFIVALAYFSTKFIARYQNNLLKNKTNVKIIESFRIGTNKFIAIVKIGESYYAIGVGKDEFTMIDKLNPDELTDFSVDSGSTSSKKIDFKEILSQVKNRDSKDKK